MLLLKSKYLFLRPVADVAKLADALDLGSSAARHVGSTPSIRTKAPAIKGLCSFFHCKINPVNKKQVY